MLAANPDDRDVALSLALGYDQVNRQRTAELLATRILEHNPKDGVALCLRGKIRLKNDDTVKAEKDLRKAVALGKDHFYSFAARMYWAECLQKLNDIPRAYELFKECKSERPDDAKAQLNFALCAKYLERFDEARAGLQEVLRLQPGDVDALLEMANIHVFKKEYDEALTILKRVEGTYPDDTQMLVQSAKIYRLRGESKRAEEYERRHQEWVKRMENRGKPNAPTPAQKPNK
jgi:Tfp pilus assembly protein PilF